MFDRSAYVLGAADLIPDQRVGSRRRLVVDDELLDDAVFADGLADLSLSGAHLVRRGDYEESVNRRVPLDSLDESWFLFHRPLRVRRLHGAFRRGLDVVSAVVGCAVLALVAPVVWLLVRLDDGGPLFYRQERVGRRGSPFLIWKFRTMRVDAESEGAAWAASDDERVTRVGRVLRRTRLDELPQFLNVVRREMSLIGPRPERPVFVRTLGRAIPYYDRRHLLMPGITGWATVRFGYGDSVTDKFRSHEFDLYYLKHRSVLLDVEILARTVAVMLLRRGQ
jgi:lipopolysaccharide/colanic/teichoic acid biosynthesis glycosyltransferase